MKPIVFLQSNRVFAENQPEYSPLPVWTDDTECISCWKPSIRDRLRILFGSHIWLRQMNFGQPLQPVSMNTDSPFYYTYADN